jgi:hypothetical protein
MELLNILSQIPAPILIAALVLWVILTIVIVYQYAKMKGLEGIRKKVYDLFLFAEKRFTESKQGEQKLKWVVQQARGLLPRWLQVVISEEALTTIIDWWFREIKDLLDDGAINGSQK